MCYCDDCQAYMNYIKRPELLDANGGTEVIPAYPVDVKILSGPEQLRCTRLGPKGMFRFSTSCCNTPIGNTAPHRAWIGLHRRALTARDPHQLDQILGPIRARIMGEYAKGTPPPGTPKKMNFRGAIVVLPFILKGKFQNKAKTSPFFQEDGVTPIVPAHVLSEEEKRNAT